MIGYPMASVFDKHLFNRFVRGNRAFVLQRNESGRPFERQEIAHAGQVLTQFNENGAVLLHNSERALGAAFVASLENEGIFILIARLVFEGDSVARTLGLSIVPVFGKE